MKRLFFALWPDPGIREKIVKLNRTLKTGRARKTKPDNIHVTLVFLGGVSSEQERLLIDGAGKIAAEPMKIVFDQMSLWRRPGILSLTCSDQPQALRNLVSELTKVAIACGVEVDKRAFKAHITLARKAGIKPEIELRPLDWRTDNFALVESVSTETGSHYRVLRTWPLTHGA